jgi:hypothetical protein
MLVIVGSTRGSGEPRESPPSRLSRLPRLPRVAPVPRGALVLGFVALAVGILGSGCGPSFQAVYECDVRFEHCYALDQQPVGVEPQKGCWRDWLHNYTYGQSRDRVEYAAARFSELSLDQSLPSVDTSTRPHRSHGLAAPLPTNAFAPPPNLAAESSTSAVNVVAPATATATATAVPAIAGATGPRVAVNVRAPAEQCTTACAERWTSCRKACADHACDACDGAYRTCVPGCFSEARQAPRSQR